MSIALEIIAEDKSLVTYRPALNSLTGSVTSTILLQQLLYWFKTTKGKPFYKFLEPCENPKYKEGDSWSEEIGFSKLIFTNAFDKIGLKYKSKTALKESEDKFKDKFFLSYFDRKTGLTWYAVDWEKLDKAITQIYSKSANLIYSKSANLISRSKETSFLEVRKPDFPYIYTETTAETTHENGSFENYSNPNLDSDSKLAEDNTKSNLGYSNSSAFVASLPSTPTQDLARVGDDHQNVSIENVEQDSLKEDLEKLAAACGVNLEFLSLRSSTIFSLIEKLGDGYDRFLKFMKEVQSPSIIDMRQQVKTEKFWVETLRYYNNWKRRDDEKAEVEKEWDADLDYSKYDGVSEEEDYGFLETLANTQDRNGDTEGSKKTRQLIKNLKEGKPCSYNQ